MSRSRGGTPFTTRPPIEIVPSVGSSRPAMRRRAVDFPHPEGPTRTRNSPAATSRSSPERTRVSPAYGETRVLSGLDLDVAAGEFLVLVGPSGCGKSTALRLIAGLDEPTEGTISIGGRVVNGVPPRDRDIAMVFQSYALYPHMTVRENLSFGLVMRKVPRQEADARLRDAAEFLGLSPYLDRTPRQLSGGQRQRVALGRALVRRPALFLFDEPLSNLDAALRVQMRAELARLQERYATTSIYVTHDQVEAMTLGHRIAILRDGVLQQVGAPLDVYRSPENLFVADFLGTPPI